MIEEHEEQLAEAFRAFTKLERMMQQTVGEALSSYFGTQWIGLIPKSVHEECERKMREQEDVPSESIGPDRQKGLLKHADFSQLVAIIDGEWDDVFHYWFKNKQTTMGRLEQIRQYRNALMHSALLPKDAPTLVDLCNNLTHQLEAGPRPAPAPTKHSPEPPPTSHVPLDRPEDTSEQQREFQRKVMSVLDEMSGLFEGERDALLQHVGARLKLCSSGLLELIRNKFRSLPGTDQAIDRLLRALPPRRPDPPELKWGLKVSKWLRWATDSFIPYRYWMVAQGQEDDEIEAMSCLYEDWLYGSYAELLERSDRSVCSTPEHIKQLLDRNQLVLWIVIDNLPFFLRGMLAKLLEESGFSIQRTERQLAMLPSETAISRKSALTGRLPSELNPALTEKDAVLQAWWGRTGEVCILEKLSDLERIDQYQANLFIYIYNRLDKLFHTADSKDFEREEEIESALAGLVSRVFVAMISLSERDPATLVISSDHGATFLDKHAEQLPVPPSAMKDEIYEEHRRFVRTSSRDALNQLDWFFLDKNAFHLHHDHAVARGWRYINSRPQGFTHGGLSPEETVVPMYVCELGKSEFERLKPSYEQVGEPLRLGRQGKLAVRVRNPYRMPIENLKIRLVDHGKDFAPIDIEPRSETETLAIDFELSSKMPVEDDAVYVNVLAEFVAGGQPRVDQAKLRIKVRQLFKTELDDDFGAMF